jgi:hypothetical protein
MSHFRLCFRDPNQRFKVVIIEAASLIHARLKATLAARDGSTYGITHVLARLAPIACCGPTLYPFELVAGE